MAREVISILFSPPVRVMVAENFPAWSAGTSTWSSGPAISIWELGCAVPVIITESVKLTEWSAGEVIDSPGWGVGVRLLVLGKVGVASVLTSS